MRKTYSTLFLTLFGLIFCSTSWCMAQSEPKFPVTGGMDSEDDAREKIVVKGLNPAFRPLYAILSDFASVQFEGGKSLNLSVLSESKKYLAREEIRPLRLSLQREINAFRGITSYSFSANSNRGIDASISTVLRLCTKSVFSDIDSIVAMWEAENRVALAEGKLLSLLQNMEEKLRYRDVFSLDYLEYFCASKRLVAPH